VPALMKFLRDGQSVEEARAGPAATSKAGIGRQAERTPAGGRRKTGIQVSRVMVRHHDEVDVPARWSLASARASRGPRPKAMSLVAWSGRAIAAGSLMPVRFRDPGVRGSPTIFSRSLIGSGPSRARYLPKPMMPTLFALGSYLYIIESREPELDTASSYPTLLKSDISARHNPRARQLPRGAGGRQSIASNRSPVSPRWADFKKTGPRWPFLGPRLGGR